MPLQILKRLEVDKLYIDDNYKRLFNSMYEEIRNGGSGFNEAEKNIVIQLLLDFGENEDTLLRASSLLNRDVNVIYEWIAEDSICSLYKINLAVIRLKEAQKNIAYIHQKIVNIDAFNSKKHYMCFTTEDDIEYLNINSENEI